MNLLYANAKDLIQSGRIWIIVVSLSLASSYYMAVWRGTTDSVTAVKEIGHSI